MLRSMCAVYCACYTHIEVDVEMASSGVFKIDPIESAYVFYDMCSVGTYMAPMYKSDSGECVITFVRGQQGETRNGRRETKFLFLRKYQEKVDAYENEKLKTENAPLLK